MPSQLEEIINGPQFGRQCRMTFVIGIETILFVMLMLLLPSMHHWLTIVILSVGMVLSISNLIILKIYHCARFSSHFLTILILLTIISVNYISGGINTSLFVWFYLIPIIAATLTGFLGLIIYGGISILAVIAFVVLPHEAIFYPPESMMWYVQVMNFIFAMILILSVLTAFLLEIHAFEQQNLQQKRVLENDREKLLHMSLHDPLSKLPNRKYFYEELGKRIRSENNLTILYMDLNGFKDINDTYGHEIGDQVLVETSKRLSHCFRDEDFIARLGGDEFIGIVSNSNKEEIPYKIMERIRDIFSYPYRSIKQDIQLNIAIGMARYPEDSKQMKKLLSIADQRMYKDKLRIKATQK
ncbi:sensory box protein, EAL domain, GGDEF domain, signal transduction protein [Legionella beliardensis]|uniref:Sensory box protein, EAL domain, GGDEF domain, signal transduction protein n=1 Tax=Legionella beliardensis TaxID=91822 RepID=A0A378I1E3_9GAMM|nr:GGDEF domain-containing protein [Legionella beliardensis]STX28495.1 sensory box protein, EAL domain, GGDEF domain, signal transduction protein [Legionella beliardensis]